MSVVEHPETPQRSPGWSTAVADVVRALRASSGTLDLVGSAHAFAVAATFHGVEGAARAAIGPGHPTLDRAVHAVAARQLQVAAELAAVRVALDGVVPFLVVKGPALAATCYQRPEYRSYVDLDVLVRPRDVAEALQSLRQHGFTLLDANWPMLERLNVHELRIGTPTGGALDLHWSLGPGPRVARGAPPARVLIERSVDVDLGDQTARTLHSADAVVHVAVHAASSGGHRLVWYTDLRGAIDHAAERGTLEMVPAVTDQWQARPALSVMLLRASRALGFPIPPALQAITQPGLWTGLTTLVDRVSPPVYTGTGRSAARLVARSAGPSTPATFGAVVAKTWRAMRAPRQELPFMTGNLDPDDPASALFSVGGPKAEAAFLRRLEDEDS